MHFDELSPTQIMQQHAKQVQELVVLNGLIISNTLLLQLNVKNIYSKREEKYGK